MLEATGGSSIEVIDFSSEVQQDIAQINASFEAARLAIGSEPHMLAGYLQLLKKSIKEFKKDHPGIALALIFPNLESDLAELESATVRPKSTPKN